MPRTPRRRRPSWWTRRGNLLLVLAAVATTVAVVIAGMRLSPAHPDRPVTIATATWAPYVGENLPDGGPMTALVQLVLAKNGYRATAQFSTWDVALERARTGQALAAFPLVASSARDQTFLRSDPLVEFEYVLFRDTNRPAPDVSSPEALGRLRVARIAGYDYWDQFDRAAGTTVEFETSLDAFTALAEGKVDLVAEGLVAGRAVLNSPSFPHDATRFAPVAGDQPWVRSTQALHLLVADTPRGKTLVTAFNRSLAEVRGTAEYRTLIASLDPPSTGQTVRLDAADGSPVTLADDRGTTLTVLPRGSTATVLAWPDTPDGSGRVRVKVTAGPATGRVGYVDISAVEVVPS